MALGPSRQIYVTNIDYTATAAMERGGIASAASGQTVSYVNPITPSSISPVGVVLTDIEAMNFMTHPMYLQRAVDDIGSKVTCASQAEVFTDFLDPRATPFIHAGKVAYLTHSGMVTTFDFAPGNENANANIGHSGIVVGRFMSDVNANGFAKLYIDIGGR